MNDSMFDWPGWQLPHHYPTTLQAVGIIGCVRFLERYYLLLVTKSRTVGTVCGEAPAVTCCSGDSLPRLGMRQQLAQCNASQLAHTQTAIQHWHFPHASCCQCCTSGYCQHLQGASDNQHLLSMLLP